MLHRSIIVVSMTGNLAAKTSLNKTAQALAQVREAKPIDEYLEYPLRLRVPRKYYSGRADTKVWLRPERALAVHSHSTGVAKSTLQ